MASSGRVMEKPVLQEQQALKCPRCDSSNTKFCYYNNYSLSQPRHFCKACKRYWTRGGTLRNVPVGGGYRKNKKVKKSGGGGGGGGSGSDTNNTSLSQQIHASNTSTSHINQLLYGLPSNSSFSNFPFQRFNSRNSVGEEGILQSFNGYNHQPQQLSGLGLSFPSSSSSMNREEHDYGAGFTHNNTQVQDLSLLATSNGYASYAANANASLLASSLQKQKQVWNGMKETSFQSLLPFQNLQMGSNGEASLVKSQEGKDNNRSAHWRVPSEAHDEPLGSLDSSLYNWNSASVATWPDLANYGSSVTPLI